MSTVQRVRRNCGKSGRVNLESVAALAGVSTATVSRVLTDISSKSAASSLLSRHL